VQNGICISTSNIGNAQFRYAHVSDLIDWNTKSWKPHLIYFLFDQHTTNAILNTTPFPQVKKVAVIHLGLLIDNFRDNSAKNVG
jgi:hypothetical protein